jgi:hypothetical protein
MNTNQNEIILYHPDSKIQLEVRLEDETVWLTQAQMSELFQTTVPNINLHLKNIFEDGELEEHRTIKDSLIVRKEGKREIQRTISFYNLDAIISVGYRIRSRVATLFRIWATRVLKEYLLKGYAIQQRVESLEYRMAETERKIDFFVRTALPPKEGVFFNGEIFDAYVFVSELIKSARTTIVLIDNYIDETVLLLLSKRLSKVNATIYTKQISSQLLLDLTKYNAQYEPVNIHETTSYHDRFLIIDGVVYHIGASLKDLGKKLFAFSKMEITELQILLNEMTIVE